MQQALVVPLLLLSAAGASSTNPPALGTVRLCGLFPRFRTAAQDFKADDSGTRRFAAFVQAIREVNNKTDGIADHLLPTTRILFTQRDSRRDGATAFFQARELAMSAFEGQGCDAIVGAASSGPSALAALALKESSTPQVSYSSTSAGLSDGSTYPYFARTVPSDDFQATGLADLVHSLFGYKRIATVASTDEYGASGMLAFKRRASALGILTLASVSITGGANDESDFSEQTDALRASGATVIVIFAGGYDASLFIEKAYYAGVGGPGFLWLGSDAVSQASTMARIEDPTVRRRVFQGFFGLTPSASTDSPVFRRYNRSRSAMPSTAGDGAGNCDLETDDDGVEMWAADNDGNASTPLACSGSDNQQLDIYAMYSYDATFALAHALHGLVEHARVAEVRGDELYEELVTNVSFEGVTGRIAFNDASADPSRLTHGDRTSGVRYDLWNFGETELSVVGAWQLCAAGAAACSEISASANFTYSTADNSKPHDGSEIGLLLPESGSGDGPKMAACAALLALQHVNEGNGSVVPELGRYVPNALQFVPKPIGIGADVASAIRGYESIRDRIDGFVDGAASRTNVHVAQLGALDSVPQLSYYSSAPELSCDVQYTHFSRSYVSDKISSSVLAEQLAGYGWEHYGVLHVRDEWAVGYQEHLAQNAFRLGLTQFSGSWTENNTAEIREAVQMMRDNGVNIIVVLSFEVDLLPLLSSAEDAGLLADNFVWIFIEGSGSAADLGTNPEATRLMAGMLSFEANPVPASGFRRLARVWSSLGPDDCTRAGAGGIFDVPPSVFSSPPTQYAAFAYDAVAGLAMGMRASDNPHHGTDVLRSLARVSFDGASGPVAFDARRDRTASGLIFTFSRFFTETTADCSTEPASPGPASPEPASCKRLDPRICKILPGEAAAVDWEAVETAPLLFRDGSATPPEDALLAREREREAERRQQRRLIILLTSVFGALLLLFVALTYRASLSVRNFKRREIAAKQVLEAIRGVHRLDHPCVLLPARAFLRMGSLREHEALRAEGQLLFYDSPRQLADKHVVFFSHQWLSFGTPDPLGVQYRVMAASLRRVIADTGWEEANVQVWVDLASIPQAKPLLKQLAVQTIACYCAAAHAFVICAPTTIHADTGEVCNVQSYQRRMWCRCEQLCHVLRKGTGTMWCATTEDDCRRLGELDSEWLMSVLRVFEGDVTDEGDYLSIVLPILGLYAELYALELKRRPQAVPWQSSRAAAAEAALCQVGSAERRAETLQLVLNEVRGAKRGEIFPPKLRMSAQRLAQLPLRKRLLSWLPTRVFGECFDPRQDLFGELIHLVERAIDLDPQILDEAVAQAESGHDVQRVQKKIERSLSRRSTASSGSHGRWTPTVMRRLPALKRSPSDRGSEAEPARAEAGGEAGADGAKSSPAETRSTTCSHTTDDSGEAAKGELDDTDGAKMEAVAADAIRAIHAYGRGDADRARAGPPGPNVELGVVVAAAGAAVVTDHAALVRSWRLSFSPTPDQEGRSPGGGVQTPTG